MHLGLCGKWWCMKGEILMDQLPSEDALLSDALKR